MTIKIKSEDEKGEPQCQFGTVSTFMLAWALRLPSSSNSLPIQTFFMLAVPAPLWSKPDCPGKFVLVIGVACIQALSLQTEERELVGSVWLNKLKSEE